MIMSLKKHTVYDMRIDAVLHKYKQFFEKCSHLKSWDIKKHSQLFIQRLTESFGSSVDASSLRALIKNGLVRHFSVQKSFFIETVKAREMLETTKHGATTRQKVLWIAESK